MAMKNQSYQPNGVENGSNMSQSVPNIKINHRKHILEYLGSGTVNQENIAGTTKNKGSQESCWGSKKSFSKSGRGPFGEARFGKTFSENPKTFLGKPKFWLVEAIFLDLPFGEH